MPSLSAGGAGGYNYVQGEDPTDPAEGEEWYATGSGSQPQGAYVYDGAQWVEQTVTDHSQLAGVSSSDHHRQTTAGAGLAYDSEMAAIYAQLGHLLTTDADGALAVQEGQISLSNLSGYPVGTGDLGFNPATQQELEDSLVNHADQEAAHHEPAKPAWSEDPNSPFSATGVDSATLQLAGDYQRVRVEFFAQDNNTSGGNNLSISVNGANSWNYWDATGQERRGKHLRVVQNLGSNESIGGALEFRVGASGTVVSGSSGATGGTGGNRMATGAATQANTSPINTISFERGASTTFDQIRVFGIDSL